MNRYVLSVAAELDLDEIWEYIGRWPTLSFGIFIYRSDLGAPSFAFF
jgi:plasmid stabilization system protein ParE